MAGENESVTHVIHSGEGASASKPNEHILVVEPSITQQHKPTGSIPVRDIDNLMMQFIVQNFNEINAMYLAFSSKSYPQQRDEDPDDNHPFVELQRDESEEVPTQNKKVDAEKSTSSERSLKKSPDIIIHDGQKECDTSRSTSQLINAFRKRKLTKDTNFYNEPFVFNESERNVRDLVASPFTKRIRDYVMPDGLKVPSNLKSYDGLSDPDDHLTMFIGTMDVHKLLEPAWCRIFNITLCGAARFWYDNLAPDSIDGFYQLQDKFRANFMQQRRFQKTQAEILGIRQKSKESLKDYLARFGKETLHMKDRSDGMMIGAFISGLRPGRPFKDLIARPPMSLEDLYIHVNGCIRADEANNANRLRDS
ncbi:gag protein [Artemisia annua]|uniref:Gag protein n=1 Tax=Artemisia annua TaxID=35608 RepID=A0A2U1KP70_ARTAN|nr:gag protein [Artemisia annua]